MRAGGRGSGWPRPPGEAADEPLAAEEELPTAKSSSSSSKTDSGRGRWRRLSRNSTLGIECLAADVGGSGRRVRRSRFGRLGHDG